MHVNQERHKCIGISSCPPDSFARLPMELLQEILLYLPSTDVAKVKMASGTFAAMPLTQRFWASRFQRGFEFHHVFEAQERDAKTRCWRILYSEVKQFQHDPNFRNRYRIWNRCLALENRLRSLSSVTLEGSPSWSFFEPGAPDDDLAWIFASGTVKEPDSSFDRSCRIL